MNSNLPSANVAPRRRISWWPVAVIPALTVVALGWVWLASSRQLQDRNILTGIVGILTFVLLLLWCLFLSRLRWRMRLGVCGRVLGLILLVLALLRFHGVTGDLVPILQWR